MSVAKARVKGWQCVSKNRFQSLIQQANSQDRLQKLQLEEEAKLQHAREQETARSSIEANHAQARLLRAEKLRIEKQLNLDALLSDAIGAIRSMVRPLQVFEKYKLSVYKKQDDWRKSIKVKWNVPGIQIYLAQHISGDRYWSTKRTHYELPFTFSILVSPSGLSINVTNLEEYQEETSDEYGTYLHTRVKLSSKALHVAQFDHVIDDSLIGRVEILLGEWIISIRPQNIYDVYSPILKRLGTNGACENSFHMDSFR